APPRRIPLHQMMGLIEHPQGKIVGTAFIRRMLEPLTGMLFRQALPRQPPHPGRSAPLLDVEIDPRRGNVAEPVAHYSFDKPDHVSNMIGRAAEDTRR